MANPRVTVNQGDLEGLAEVSANGISFFSFRGIPYAEPPVGKLRFKPTFLHPPWTGVRDATKDGNRSLQIDVVTKEIDGSEDCLFLNVYTPDLPEKNIYKALFPVMVFIHGGGFVQGSGLYKDFRSEFIVEQGTVLVSINYRLGPMGFLCLDTPDAPGNVGLRDQTLALEWVKDNIQFFNGDQNNVTIFGVSAGAAAVEYLEISPMSEGLFHKTILMSGSVLNPWAITKDPLELIEKVKKKLNVVITDPKDVLQYFQNVDANMLVEASAATVDEKNFQSGEVFAFTPVIEKNFDGIKPFLNKKPLELLRSGSFIKVPTIIGMCENEGELFQYGYEYYIGKLSEQNLFKYMPQLSEVDIEKYDKILKEVYKKVDNDAELHIREFMSDVLILGGVYSSLKIKKQFTQEHQNFLYMFTYMGNMNTSRAIYDYKKPVHADDCGYIALLRKNNMVEPSSEDVVIRNRMVKMWTDFAKTGNPTPEQTDLVKEKWLPIGKGEEMNLMEIGKELKMKILPWKVRMDLWENMYNDM